MTEITIIKSNELGDERVLSKEERDVLFRELSKELDIPYFYLEELGKLEDESITKERADNKTDILILLLRKILDFDNIIPIISEIKNSTRTIDEFRKEYNIYDKGFKKGGSTHFLPIQLVKTQNVILLNNLEEYLKTKRSSLLYNVYQNTSVDICGLIINNTNSIVSYYIDQVSGVISLPGRLRSGAYNNNYLWNVLFEPYDNFYSNMNDIKIDGVKLNLFSISKKKIPYVIFTSDTQIKQICNILVKYLSYSSKYKLKDYISNLLNLTDDVDLKGTSYLFKSLQKCLNIINEPTIISIAEPVLNLDPVNNFIKEMNNSKIFMGEFSFKYNDSVWFDLISLKSLIILEKLSFIYHDKSISQSQKKQYENDIENMINKRKMDLITTAYIQSQNKVYNLAILKEITLRWLYIKKFGFDKFNQLCKKMPVYGIARSMIIGTRGSIMDYITKDEIDILKIDYENRINIKIKEPWLFILNKMKIATKQDKLKLLNDLGKYMDASQKSNDWIRSPDGTSIICPHVKDQIEMQHLKDTEIRDAILKYAGESPLFDGYYCKICGELITYTENMDGFTLFEGDQPAVWHSLDEELKDYIWKNTNQIVRNFVEFKELRSNKYINSFITNITSKLYDFINLIEKKLIKSKTISLDDINNKKKLFTIIYIYAILIKIILDNHESITFSKLIGRQPQKNLISYVLNKIISTQNIIINKLPEINETYLESSLEKAFQNINLVIDNAKLKPPPDIDLSSTLSLDPIFRYIANMTVIAELLKSSSDTAKIKKLHDESYTTLKLFNLDSSKINTLYKDDYLYQNIIIPVFSKDILASFDNLESIDEIIKGKDKSYKSRDDYLEDYYEGYFIESFNKLVEYVHSKIYLKPIYHVNIIENDGIYEIIVKLADEYIKYDKNMEALLKREKVLRYLKKYYNVSAYANMPFKHSCQFLESNIKHSSEILLSRTYGDVFNKDFNTKLLPKSIISNARDIFHKHKWVIYVYVPFNKFTVYDINSYDETDLLCYTDKDFNGIFNTPNFYNYKLIDTLCKICLCPFKTISKYIPDPIKIINDDIALINFYNYYENRCPSDKSNLFVHEFVNEICKNCGFTRDMYFNKNLEYYKKYQDKFAKDIKIIKKDNVGQLPINFDSMIMQKELILNVPELLTKWKFNSNIINELIMKTYNIITVVKIKKTEYYNILINLGLIEKYEYDKIINGSDTPYKIVDDNDILQQTRINKLDIYIKELIFDYTTLINYRNLSNLAVDIKNITELASSTELAKLLKLHTIKEVFSFGTKLDYFQLIKAIKQIHSTSNLIISQFLLEYLCQLILHIRLYLETLSKKISDNFISYFISKLIAMERSSSKLKEAKSMLIEATQNQDMDDPNLADHDNSRVYDDLVKGNVDQYSYEGSDISPIDLDAGSYNLLF